MRRHVSRLKPPKGCIFCGDGGLSREHLWPAWARDILPETNGYSQIGSNDPSDGQCSVGLSRQFERQGRITDARLRVVCRACNNGWMSRLEESSRLDVTALILGEQRQIGTEGLKNISEWITLKIIVADASPGGRSVFLTDERRGFFAERIIPSPLTIQLYRCGESPWDTIFHSISSKASHQSNGKPNSDNLKIFLFGAGEALFHAVYGRNLNIAAAPNPGLSLSLIPPAADSTWPPSQRLSVEQAHILATELRRQSSPAFRWHAG